jgi:hypothetical protein
MAVYMHIVVWIMTSTIRDLRLVLSTHISDVRHESCHGPAYSGLHIIIATVPCYFNFNLIHSSKCFGSV